MSILTYNGVTLPNATCTNFVTNVAYDSSDTDWYLSEYDLTFTAIVNAAYMALLATDLIANFSPITTNSAAIMTVIRNRLYKPKQALSYTFAGVELIPQKQTGNIGNVDARNGPQPKSVRITELTNTTFLIEFRIVAAYWENPAAAANANNPYINNRPGNNVLTNRWTETVEMNNFQQSTRTREGKFIIRSDNVSGFIADKLRQQMAVVGVPEGFLRKSSRYVQSNDGLAIEYSITDEEVFKLPPSPAFEASGSYRERYNRTASVRYADVNCRLKADKKTDQAKLIHSAATVCITKIRFCAGGQDYVLESANVDVNMYENEVEVRMSVMYQNNTKRFANICGVSADITRTPLSEDFQGTRPGYLAYGTAGLLLQAAAYYDPSITTSKLDKTGQMTGGKLVGTIGANGA